MTRPSWDEYFLCIAIAASARADCSRRQVGAVIAGVDHRVVSLGYNGSPSGKLGCLTDGACPRATSGVPAGSSYTNCIAVHAEANAIIHGSYSAMQGATIYVTDEPCHECRRLIAGAGIVRMVWPDTDESISEALA